MTLRRLPSPGLLGLALVGALAPASAAGTPEQARCSIYYDFPGGTRFLGNGVLVADDWVLTSAIVLDGRDAALLTVIAGDDDVCTLLPADPHEQVRSVDSYLWPTPDNAPCGTGYTPAPLENDIALMHLSAPVVPGLFVQPMDLPNPGDDFAGFTAEVHGWWMDSPCTGTLACNPTAIALEVLTNADAHAQIGGVGPFTDCNVAAKDPSQLEVPQQGSSGSGLFVQTSSGWVLTGTVSYAVTASGCSVPSYPTVFTRTSEYLGWISDVTSAPPPISLGTPPPNPCGSGCTSLALTSFGSPNTGNSGFRFDIGGAPAGSLVGLFLGVGGPTPGLPWEGGVIYAPTGVSFWHWLGFPTVTGGGCSGSQKFPFEIPPVSALIGKQLTAQGVLICPAPPLTFVPTNALSITIF